MSELRALASDNARICFRPECDSIDIQVADSLKEPGVSLSSRMRETFLCMQPKRYTWERVRETSRMGTAMLLLWTDVYYVVGPVWQMRRAAKRFERTRWS